MVWQDAVLTLGNIVFAVSFLPTVINKKTRMPRTTTIPSALFLYTFVVAYYSLQLYFSAFIIFVLALMWTYVAWKRAL